MIWRTTKNTNNNNKCNKKEQYKTNTQAIITTRKNNNKNSSKNPGKHRHHYHHHRHHHRSKTISLGLKFGWHWPCKFPTSSRKSNNQSSSIFLLKSLTSSFMSPGVLIKGVLLSRRWSSSFISFYILLSKRIHWPSNLHIILLSCLSLCQVWIFVRDISNISFFLPNFLIFRGLVAWKSTSKNLDQIEVIRVVESILQTTSFQVRGGH